MNLRLIIIFAALISSLLSEASETSDTLFSSFPDLTVNVAAPTPDHSDIRPYEATREQRWWLNQALKGKLNMKDTTVIYPRFIKFCVDVYNWADYVFNSYNEDYVVGTGKRWKARVVSDNWVDSYSMMLPRHMQTHMLSDIYANIGAYIQYMAVSMGYTYDMNKLFGNKPIAHKKWEFGFNCARFNAEIYYHENTGGTNLRKFGQYKKGHFFKEEFPGLELHNFGIEAYYFINNKKYSQGAAYNFSKIQKKNQGSFIVGAVYTNLKLSFDFSKLPENLLPYLTIPATSYLFHYKSYAILFGYGFNWVITPKLLFNISAMPSVGASHCYEDSLEGAKWMFSANISARSSLTYNLGNFFIGLIGKMNGHWYKSGTYSLFSSVENLSANIGIRF